MALDDPEEEFSRKWGFLGYIYSLSESDILKVDKIMKLNLLEVLNYLSFKIEREKVVEWKNKNKNKKG